MKLLKKRCPDYIGARGIGVCRYVCRDLSASHINTSFNGCMVKGVQTDSPLAGR